MAAAGEHPSRSGDIMGSGLSDGRQPKWYRDMEDKTHWRRDFLYVSVKSSIAAHNIK